MATNVLPLFGLWSYSGAEVNTSRVVTGDGHDVSFTVTLETSYLYYGLRDGSMNGKTVKIGFSSFTASDNLGKIQIRLYDATRTNYTVTEILTAGVSGAYSVNVDVPTDCGEVRIVIRHEWDSDGIDPASTISVTGMYMEDTSLVPNLVIAFHKVLAANLPASVTPGTEHIYFTTDGNTAGMYLSTTAGGLIPVGTTGAGNTEAAYNNVYTQAHIDERKEEIKALQTRDFIAFTILTDIHVRDTDGDAGRYNQVRDVLMVAEQLQLDFVACCGDILSYTETLDVFDDRLEKVQDIFEKCKVPVFSTRGNHDYNSDATGNVTTFTKDLCVTNRDWYSSITSKLPQSEFMKMVLPATNPTAGYYYVDDYFNKHRMIFCNTEEVHQDENGEPYVNPQGVLDCFISGIRTTDQVSWLVNEAMNMVGKLDWTVSIFSHEVPYTDAGETDKSEFHGYGLDDPDLMPIFEAFVNGTALTNYAYSTLNTVTHEWSNMNITKDFSVQGAIKTTGWYAGHIHDDCYRKVNGVNYIVNTCTCSNRRTSWDLDTTPTKLPPERNDTNLAMSMNIFIIDKATRTVSMIKLGSKRDNAVKTSSDKYFTY